VLHLKSKEMTPSLFFHLNVFELINLFKQLVGELEARELEKYPNHYKDSDVKKKKPKDRKIGHGENEKERDEDTRIGLNPIDGEKPDKTQPHKDFSFLLGGPIPVDEFEKICEDVAERDQFIGDVKDHVLMRALKRGIGLYIDDHHFTAYRVAVMKLAMQGKLGVVLSDSSLAYGVNMPFRTCVFCGEMGGELDTLIAQQMAGRSGRRGMDTQGHLVYAGARASFVQELMLAKIPSIRGKEPRYHSVFLQEMLSPFSNPVDYFPHQMQVLAGQPLADSIDGVQVIPHFRQESIAILLRLHLIEECNQLSATELVIAKENDTLDFAASTTPTGYRPRVAPGEVRASCAKLWMVWELRIHLAESLLLGSLLPKLHREFFVGQADTKGDNESTQIKFCLFMIMICHRQPYNAELVGKGHFPQPLSNHSFIQSHQLGHKFTEWEEEIAHFQDAIAASDVFGAEWMLLKPDVAPGNPLDATLFDCIVNPCMSDLAPGVKQFLKESLTSLSIKLIKMHNALMRDKDTVTDPVTGKFLPGRYAQFEIVTRKCFSRLQYISRELIQEIVNIPKAI
jgi:hypothetical protein